MTKIKIPGVKIIDNTQHSFSSNILNAYTSEISSYEIKSSVRSSAKLLETDFKDGDLIYYEFSDGSNLYINYEEAKKLNIEAKKSLESSRNTNDFGENDWVLPMEIDIRSNERGVLSNLIPKFVSFVLKGTIDRIISKGGENIVDYYAHDFEKKMMLKEGLLNRIDETFNLVDEIDSIDSSKPILLFIHGTNSKTKNAFEGLTNDNGKLVFKSIFDKYQQNILAFEHHTLTKSVLSNTLFLVQHLPKIAELCIISHSRGGLVLDTLQMCIECCTSSDLKKQVDQYFVSTSEIDEFNEIIKILRQKTISIKQTIKVACPAYGTTLLSENPVNLIRVLTQHLKKFTISPLLDYAEKLIIAMLQTKDKKDILPGLAIMNPESPYLKLINGIEISAPVEQFVLAGRSSLEWDILHSLKFIGTYLVIQEKSDMVVNTKSMHQGVKLFSGYKYYLAKEGKVHHSSYFVESITQNLIQQAIASEGKIISGAEYVTPYGTPKMRGAIGIEFGKVFENTISGQKPIVILIPGIMGSTLSKGDNRYWLHYGRFAVGGLLRLKVNTTGIKADGLIATSYCKFVDHLKKNGFDVYTHPYDWRLHLRDSAAELEIKINEIISKSNGKPIRVVSHSMGGLLMRALELYQAESYRRLSSQPDFRWIMAGTPWYGSYRAVETIIGRSSNIKKLDKIALFNSMKDLLQVFTKLPGLLELLPMNINNGIKDKEVTSAIFWNELYKSDEVNADNWIEPDKNDLNELKIYKTDISKYTFSDASKVYYIAGRTTKNDTPENYSINGKDVVFHPTASGDGTVTWKEGIPQELIDNGNVYYINVPHGQLVNDDKFFPGILSLIKNGTTYFSKDPSNVTRGKTEKNKVKHIYKAGDIYTNNNLELEQEIFDHYDDEADSNAALELLNVSVSHGDLKYADGPLMIGHFRGEHIAKAEKVLDEALEGALSDRFKNKVYPGETGTSLFIIRDKKKKPNGALVIGLGDQFEMTGFLLSQAVKESVIQAFYQYKEHKCISDHSFPETISTLLIGTAYGNLSVATSIKSILTGIQLANKSLVDNSDGLILDNLVKNVEILEIFNDKAHSVFYTLKQFHKDGFINFEKPTLRNKPGALKSLSIDYGSDKWNQLTIRGANTCPMAEDSCQNNNNKLTFNLNVGIAKEESKEVYIDKDQINDFLFELIKEEDAQKAWDKRVSKVLFERLIPQDFKVNIRMQNNLVINLDKNAASYPWELIQDTSISDEPICVTAGMIRQLNYHSCSTKKRYAENNNVLIIGDPSLDSSILSQLPGARNEALLVNQIFINKAFTSNYSDQESANDIIMKLYETSYRYIHIAAHGVFDEKNSLKSGVVIGTKKVKDKSGNIDHKNEKLSLMTAAEIVQLDVMPEFVFINTCYSGKSSEGSSDLSLKTYEFAANIGEEFIRNGVKAIIVAGWPVYDDMALLFAQKFYEYMFEGENFGEAVQKARKACFDAEPDKNTWGAYQCYGDPMFTFETKGKTSVKTYSLPQEIKNDLENIISQADNAQYRSASLKKKLELIDQGIQELNIEDADILEKQAMAEYKLGDNIRANEIFEKLFISEKATFSLKSLEQIYNVQAKIAVEDNDIVSLDELVNKMNLLLSIGKTSERYSLLGSTYKRLAYLQRNNGQTSEATISLQNALDAYINAKDPKLDITLNGNKSKLLKAIKSEFDCYTTHIIWQLKYLLNQTSKSSFKISTYKEGLEKALKNLNYYDQISEFNLLVTEVLVMADNSVDVEKYSNKLIAIFDKVWDDYGAFNHLKGEYEHLENIVAFLGGQNNKHDVLKKVIDHIRNIENSHKTI